MILPKLKMPKQKQLSPLGAATQRRRDSEKPAVVSSEEKNYWKLEVMDNAFRFYLPDNTVDWAIEHDHLIADNVYDKQTPVGMMDMLETLEIMASAFTHIEITEKILLVRKRFYSPGLFLNIHERNILFFGDTHLKSLNFLDFYSEYIDNNKENFTNKYSNNKYKTDIEYADKIIN